MSTPSHLFIFDFDDTLSVRGSCLPIEELAPNQEELHLDTINDHYCKIHRCWNRRMTEVHERLAEQNIRSEQLIEAFRKIELSPGTDKLLRHLHANHHRIIVLSNACDLVVEECLRAHQLSQCVEKIESNPVRQLEPIMIIDDYEQPLQTDCSLCDPNMCKGLVIDRYRKTNPNQKIIFTGDGDNDVCPALRLREADHVFARVDPQAKHTYAMYDLLTHRHQPELKSELSVWTTMDDVHQTLIDKHLLWSFDIFGSKRDFYSAFIEGERDV